MKTKLTSIFALACAVVIATAAQAQAQAAPAPKAEPEYKADIPKSILTPDTVETERLGTLNFFDGMPDEATVQKVYDNLDFQRGMETFLTGMPAGSIQAYVEGLDSIGVKANNGIAITENLADAKALLLTPNTSTIYAVAHFDLSKGAVVLVVPPGMVAPIDDAYFRFVTNVGFTGPDLGKGGKYLLVPPGYTGELPREGYFIVHSLTYRNWMLGRLFVLNNDKAATIEVVKEKMKVYLYSQAANPPATVFVNTSGLKYNTVHANDFSFYEELNTVVQYEPADAFDPELVGVWAAIGIKKGQPFAPDARMKKILTEAMAVANATARAITFSSRNKEDVIYPGRQWFSPINGAPNHEFLYNGERALDRRTLYLYYATAITPSMINAGIGKGSAYAIGARDSQGRYLEGSKTYSLTMPGPMPAKDFWAVTVYDGQTRSLLETDQVSAGLDSNHPDVKANADGSFTVWFGPKAPAGKEGNWIQTMPGKSFNTIIRLYGPLEPWFDKTWKPGDLELVK